MSDTNASNEARLELTKLDDKCRFELKSEGNQVTFDISFTNLIELENQIKSFLTEHKIEIGEVSYE